MKYRIGEFSKITKISNRMLRYLDHENILKPSFVDDNGYRYYSDSDLEKVSKIMCLKKYHFSYGEIREILEQHLENDHNVYMNKLNLLKTVVSDYDKLISELEQDYSACANKMVNRYDVQMMNRVSFHALKKRSIIKDSELESFIEEHVNNIYEHSVTLLGNYFITFYNNEIFEEGSVEDDQLDVGFYQPIVENMSIDGFETIMFEDAISISTIHYGCYDQIYNGYNSLYQWAEDNGYKIVGAFSEKYYVDAYFASNRREYVTEISINVSKDD